MDRVYAKTELINDYLKRLVTKKIKTIGLGVEAMVFQHPTLPNVVVKLMGRHAGFADWAAVCLKHQNNPHLPKVYSMCSVTMKHIKNGDDKYHYLVFTEKLQPVNGEIIEKGIGIDFFQWLCDTTQPKPSKYLPYLEEVSDPQLRSALLLAFKKPSGIIFDLSWENMMLRGGSQLVINDPWLRGF